MFERSFQYFLECAVVVRRLATPKNAGKALIAVSQQKYLEKQLLWPREEKADSFQSKALQTGITVRQLSGRVGVKGLSTPVSPAS